MRKHRKELIPATIRFFSLLTRLALSFRQGCPLAIDYATHSDIAEHHDNADRPATLQLDRSGTIIDRNVPPVLRYKKSAAGQRAGNTIFENAFDWVAYSSLRVFIHDDEHAIHVAADRVFFSPSGE